MRIAEQPSVPPVRADHTVTLGLPKIGLYAGAGIDHTGTVHVVDIGIPQSFVDSIESRTILMTHGAAKASLPLRAQSSHKGTFGHAGLIAGSVGKTGAAAMAAKAALRVGTGLVTVAVPSSVNDTLENKIARSHDGADAGNESAHIEPVRTGSPPYLHSREECGRNRSRAHHTS